MRESVVFNEEWQTGLRRYGEGAFDLVLDDVPYGIEVGKMAFLQEAGTTVRQKNGSRLNPRKRKLREGGLG